MSLEVTWLALETKMMTAMKAQTLIVCVKYHNNDRGYGWGYGGHERSYCDGNSSKEYLKDHPDTNN